jgi:hypothetical protein
MANNMLINFMGPQESRFSQTTTGARNVGELREKHDIPGGVTINVNGTTSNDEVELRGLEVDGNTVSSPPADGANITYRGDHVSAVRNDKTGGDIS